MIKDSQIFFRIRVNKKNPRSPSSEKPQVISLLLHQLQTRSRQQGLTAPWCDNKAATHWEKMGIDFSGIYTGRGVLVFFLMFEECTGGLVLLFWGSLGILLYIIYIIYIWITYNCIYVYIISIYYMKLEP